MRVMAWEPHVRLQWAKNFIEILMLDLLWVSVSDGGRWVVRNSIQLDDHLYSPDIRPDEWSPGSLCRCGGGFQHQSHLSSTCMYKCS